MKRSLIILLGFIASQGFCLIAMEKKTPKDIILPLSASAELRKKASAIEIVATHNKLKSSSERLKDATFQNYACFPHSESNSPETTTFVDGGDPSFNASFYGSYSSQFP